MTVLQVVSTSSLVISTWSELVLAELISTARSLNVFRAFKSKDTSTDEDEGQKTKSKKTFSFSIIFKERKMATPTRIIQKNCSRTLYLLYPHPLPPTPHPHLYGTWFARARLRLNTGRAGPSVFLLAEWNTTYDVFFRIKGVFNSCHVLFSEIREVYDATEKANVSWEMRHSNAYDWYLPLFVC